MEEAATDHEDSLQLHGFWSPKALPTKIYTAIYTEDSSVLV